MAKLYVFGIGGTGSRVLKSLTMLLASGLKLENGFDTVVPIIIDPDTANGDMNRTADILIKYQNIYKEVGNDNTMFGTKISTLRQLTNGSLPNVADNFKFNIDGSGQKFGDSIDYNGLDNENRALIDLLFSTENIEADMTVGFKGNPNIGSIVLNKFVESSEYREFTNSFNQGDAIFIVSSIFGGTGASGFPLLLKNLRNSEANVTNSNLISNSTVGAISYLPYFKVADSPDANKAIDSATFFGKTKAALSYYEHSIFKNDSLNAFYYLGDYTNNYMEYAEGKLAQKNNAHFLELAGALAIYDFTKDINTLGETRTSTIKEFGIEEDGEQLNFKNLGGVAKQKISEPLSKLYLMTQFLNKSLDTLSKTKGNFNRGNKGITPDFYTKEFYTSTFKKFIDHFELWVNEMENNDISFAPFHTNQDHKNLMDFITSVDQGKSGLFSKNKVTGDHLIKSADKLVTNQKYDSEEDESRFLKIYDDILTNHINDILN